MKLLTLNLTPAEVTIQRFLHRAFCGFSYPTSDDLEGKLDLSTHCMSHPATTFYQRAEAAAAASQSGVCAYRSLHEPLPGAVRGGHPCGRQSEAA